MHEVLAVLALLVQVSDEKDGFLEGFRIPLDGIKGLGNELAAFFQSNEGNNRTDEVRAKGLGFVEAVGEPKEGPGLGVDLKFKVSWNSEPLFDNPNF